MCSGDNMKLIHEETNATKLQGMIIDLWQLLDDIDTLDDACRANNEAFRRLTRDCQQKRHKILTSDGYNLYFPDSK